MEYVVVGFLLVGLFLAVVGTDLLLLVTRLVEAIAVKTRGELPVRPIPRKMLSKKKAVILVVALVLTITILAIIVKVMNALFAKGASV